MWPQFIQLISAGTDIKHQSFHYPPYPTIGAVSIFRWYNNEKYLSLFLYQYDAADPSSPRFEMGLFP